MKFFSDKKPSDIFIRLVCHSGSKVIDCDHCGRVHYDYNGEFMEEGELEDLQEKAKKDPEKYVGHDGDIYWGTVMGKATVTDCPCGFLGWFENAIWSDRKFISEYLIKMAAARLNQAKETMKIASETHIVNQT